MHIRKVQEGVFTKILCHNCHKEKVTHRITSCTKHTGKGYCLPCAKELYQMELDYRNKWGDTESDNTSAMLSRL